MSPDPRRNAPSASGMPRYHACDAAWQMELAAREQNAVPDGDASAQSGQRIHGELHIPESIDLELWEGDMADRCRAHLNEIVRQWDCEGGDEYRESRLGMTPLGTVISVTPDTKAKIIFSGQLDGGLINKPRSMGLIWDFKTLMGEHETAQSNLQLLSLAVLAAKRWSLDSVRVALIQPWRGAPTVADFDKDGLKRAEEFITRTIHEITQPSAVAATTPGKWCHFCPGRLVCEDFRRQPVAAIECIAPHTLPAEGANKAVYARVAEFDNENLAAILDDPRFKMAAWLVEAAKSLAAKRIAEGQTVPGWELREVEGKRTVTDPRAAYEALGTLKPEEFFGACSVSLPKLEEAVRVASGKRTQTRYNKTQLEAKKEITDKCGHLITRKKTKRLAKVGAEITDDNGNDT